VLPRGHVGSKETRNVAPKPEKMRGGLAEQANNAARVVGVPRHTTEKGVSHKKTKKKTKGEQATRLPKRDEERATIESAVD